MLPLIRAAIARLLKPISIHPPTLTTPTEVPSKNSDPPTEKMVSSLYANHTEKIRSYLQNTQKKSVVVGILVDTQEEEGKKAS